MPQLSTAYFFLGNSYDQLYKPAKQGDATNDGYIQKAIDNYRKAADKNTDKQWKKSSLEYLAAAYGSDKLNDPAKAEPVYKEIITLDRPSRPITWPSPSSTRTRAATTTPRRRAPEGRAGEAERSVGARRQGQLLQPPG